MPIRLQDLVAGKRTIPVEFEAGTLNITYDPAVITADNEREELQLRLRGMVINALALSLSRTIVAWDLTDDSGKPIEVKLETLTALGYDVLNYLMTEINKDFRPNVLTAGRSGGSASDRNGKVEVAD